MPVNKFQSRYYIGNYRKTDLSKMHEWISANTPIDAVFLPLPDDESFLCEAKRSIPVGYKAIIHEPFFLLPWYQQFKDVYGVELIPGSKKQRVIERAVAFYPQRADSVIHSSIPIDYRIWDTSTTSIEILGKKTILHREGNYILTTFVK